VLILIIHRTIIISQILYKVKKQQRLISNTSNTVLRNQCQRRGGSSPFIRTNEVFVQTKLNRKYKNQSEN